MAKWTDYTIDTNPTDTDEVMTLDADKSPKANKRVTLSTLADYFLDKLASNVFAKLETQNKTVIGALNELNSKAKSSLIRGFYTGSDPQKLILQPFSTYILTFANVSSSNISSECDLAIIVTSNSSANTSKITWVTQSVAYMHSMFFFDTDNWLSFNIDPKSDNVWLVISLTRL